MSVRVWEVYLRTSSKPWDQGVSLEGFLEEETFIWGLAG